MLNLRCLYCQTPFTVGRAEMLTALINMDEKSQNHHDAHCPRCRRANSISRQRMELFFPNWREAAKQAASMPVAEAVSVTAAVKTEPLPRSLKSAVVKTAASKKTSAANAKVSTSKRKRSSKPASAKKNAPAPKGVASKAKKPASKPATKPASKPGAKKK